MAKLVGARPGLTAATDDSPRPPVYTSRGARAYRLSLIVLLLAVGLAVIVIGALAVSWTIPFQEWDAYASGTWSMLIYQGHPILTQEIDPILAQRPVVYVGQGLIWRWLGKPSMRAGRLYSLFFSVLLISVTFLLARRRSDGADIALLAAFLAASSPLVTEQVSSTLTDIPAAAVAWTGIFALFCAREGKTWAWWPLAGVLLALSILAKIIAIPLIGLVLLTTTLQLRRLLIKGWKIVFAGASLILPLALVFLYYDRLRGTLTWANFLYSWAGPYYRGLAASSRVPSLKTVTWFGVGLTQCFVLAVATSCIRHFHPSSSASPSSGNPGRPLLPALLTALTLLYVIVGTRGAAVPLRDWPPSLLDRWLAGMPATVAASVVLLVLARQRRRSQRLDLELGLIVAGFFCFWWATLGYDRRFLVLCLPGVAIMTSRWLADAIAVAGHPMRVGLLALVSLLLVAMGWEGVRRMDHAYPVFSAQFLEINKKAGLEPEAKLIAIFGDSARVVEYLQKELRANPRLRVISMDNRLKFYLGTRMKGSYPSRAEHLRGFDLFVWVENIGVREQYRQAYGVEDPLGQLKATGMLSSILKTQEYEVFRIRS